MKTILYVAIIVGVVALFIDLFYLEPRRHGLGWFYSHKPFDPCDSCEHCPQGCDYCEHNNN